MRCKAKWLAGVGVGALIVGMMSAGSASALGGGIVAESGSQNVTITIGSGDNVEGGVVAITGGAGTITITNNGTITNDGQFNSGSGISATNDQGEITINNNGALQGILDGAIATSNSPTGVTINNTTSSLVQAGSGDGFFAIDNGSGVAEINTSAPNAVIFSSEGSGLVAESATGQAIVNVSGPSTTIAAGAPGVSGNAGVAAIAENTETDTNGPAAIVNVAQDAAIAVDGNQAAGVTAHTGTPSQGGPNGSAGVAISIGNGIDMRVSGFGDAGVSGYVSDPTPAGTYRGTGDVSINVGAGTITVNESGASGTPGGTSVGIGAYSAGGDVLIENAANVDVTGGVSASIGLDAETSGFGGAAVISTGSIASGNGDGIRVVTQNGNSTVSVQAGNVAATNGDGINATASGSGTVTVVTNAGTDVRTNTPSAFWGISATSAQGSAVVDVNGTVSDGGVFVSAGGNGTAVVNTLGAVTDTQGDGITASAAQGPVTINTLGAVTAGGDGIVGEGNGAGPVSVEVGGNVVALGPIGVDAFNQGTGAANVAVAGSIDISGPSLVGVEAGTFYGPAAVTLNSGDTVIAGAPGAVGGAGVVALSVLDAGGNSGVSVNLGNNVSIAMQGDGSAGVTAHTGVPGAIGPNGSASAVISAGTGLTVHVSGYSDAGVIAFVADPSGAGAYGGDGNVSVTIGGGSIVVDEFGAVGSPTGTNTSTGVAAISFGGNVVINNSAQVTVTGGVSTSVGLLTSTAGSGTSTVNSLASVTSGNGDGIRTTTVNGANVVNVLSGGVTAIGGDGIDATASGAGVVVVATSAATTVTSTGPGAFAGISAVSGSGNVTIVSNGVVGDGGISASTGGSGSIVVNTNAAVTNSHGGGVSAIAAQGPVTIVDNGAITASGNGIVGQDDSSGAVSIVVEQNVQANGQIGVQAFNQGEGAASTIVAVGQSITGPSVVGVEAGTLSGPASVTLKGGDTVVAGASGEVGGAGVVALGLLDMTNASGPAVSVTLGNNDSIAFQGDGSAGVTAHTGLPGVIGPNGSASAVITAGTGLAVHVSGYSDAGVIGFVADPSGKGVYGGDGNVSVTIGGGSILVDELGATGSPTGTDTSTGVGAISFGGNVLIDNSAVVTVTGGVSTSVGLLTSTAGGGTSTVNSRANVVSENGDGIRATTANGADIVNLLTGSVVAVGGDGINAIATGSGSVTVNVATGTTVLATSGAGVSASSGSGNVTIVDNGTIADGGISASTGGLGAVTVTTNGLVTDTHGDGVRADAVNGADTVTVQTGQITATGGDGIDAVSVGNGSITINTAVGTTVSSTGPGAFAGIFASGGSGTVTVTNAGVVADGGITASTGGAGSVNVSTTGTVTNTHGVGISATSNQGASTIVDNAVVTASGAGVSGFSNSTAGTSVTIKQAVTAGAGDAVEAEDEGTGLAAITIASGTSKAPLALTNTGGAGAIAAGVFGPAKVTLGNYDTITTASTVASGADGALAVAVVDAANPAVGAAASVVTGTHATITVVGNDDSGIAALVGLAGQVGINGAAGVSIQTGAGLSIHVSGFSDSGIFAATTDYLTGKFVGLGSATVTVGTGTILVDEVGAIGAPTGAKISDGVGAISGGGNVSIDDSAQITVTGGQDISIGLQAVTGGAGDSLVNARAAITTGNGDGIQSITDNGANTVILDAGKIAAAGGDGIDARALGSGDVTVVLSGGSVSTATPGADYGVAATSSSGDVAVTTNVAVTDSGILASTGGAGTATVTTNAAVTDTNGDGIRAVTSAGADNVAVDAGKVTATNGDGIDAVSGAGAINILTQTGTTVKTLTPGAFRGVSAVSASGDITILTLGAVADGGIAATTGGTGTVSIITEGAVTNTAGDGIDATGGGQVAISTTGAVKGSGAGIFAQRTGGGANGTVQAVADANVTAGTGAAVEALNDGVGAAEALANNDEVIRSTGGTGVLAVAVNGQATAFAGQGSSVTAGATGLSPIGGVSAISFAFADNLGPSAVADLDTGVSVAVKGNVSAGVDAQNHLPGAFGGAGGATVTVGNGDTITVSGLDDAGVFASTLDTSGAGAYATSGNVTANVGTGTITVNESGATGTATGQATNAGIGAITGGGNATVNNAATISVAGGQDSTVGIVTFTEGAGSSLITDTGQITSKLGDGIRATTANGPNTVNLLSGSITANKGAGVNAISSGSGLVKITVGAGVNISALDGVSGTADTGLLILSNGGTITAAGGGVGVLFNSPGAMALENEVGATITGASSSTAFEAGGGGALNLENQGSLGGTKLQNNGLAIDITGGTSLTLDNAAGANLDGEITGDNNVTFTNEGTWATRGTSDFGTAALAFTNTLTNTGLIQVGDNNPADAAVASTFTDLGAFHNGTATATGTLSMINSHVGDTLTINAPFTATTGHSELGLDAALGPPGSKADELVLTQGSSGQTLIVINNTTPGAGALNAKGIIVVTGQTHDSDFALDPAQANYDSTLHGIDSGLFTYVLNDVKGNEALVGIPGLPAMQLGAMGGAVAQVWSSTTPASDMETSLMASFVSDDDQQGDTGGLRVWSKALNWSASRLNGGQTQFGASFGTTTDIGQPVAALSGLASLPTEVTSGNQQVNLNAGYAQNTSSLTTGVDLERHVGQTSAWAWGVSGGYVESEQGFAASSAPALYSGAMATVQGSYIRQGFYLDGDIKVDVLRASFLGNWEGATRQGSTAASFGAEADAGYHMALGSHWTLEPLASLSLERTTLGGMTLDGEQVTFPLADTAKASLGAKIAANFGIRGYAITGSATARVWDEFGSQNGLLFDGVASGLVPFGPGSGALGDMSAQVNVANLSQHSSAFVSTAYQFNAAYKAESILAGFKFAW